MKLLDLTGQRFGKLIVIERDLNRTNGTYWKCQCDCGNIISTRKDTLTRTKGNKTSCGCDTASRNGAAHIKNEIGNTYGKLTVLERAPDLRHGEARWKCQCQCGNIALVSGVHLRNGTVQSCGCKRHEKGGYDETGKRYGKLTVLKRSEERTDGSHVFWECLCDCGNLKTINGTYLRAGISTNCGCERSVGEAKIAKILSLYDIPFKREYTFPDLVGNGGGRLRFDFGVLDKHQNLLYLIEYDGVQHFKANCFGGNDQEFDQLKNYDKKKNEYCIKNNIPLLRIPYTKLATLTINDLIFQESEVVPE